jgi:septum formation protein
VAAVAETGATVIGGDTDVILDGRALGQPDDEANAREFLNALSGRRHEVLGGVAVLRDGEELVGVESSGVRFRRLGEAEIDAYVASGEWHGRAGGYAVQGLGSALVEEVRGDLANVIGLPVALLLRLAPELLSPR